MLLKTLYSILVLMTSLNVMLVGQHQKVRMRSPELTFARAPFDTVKSVQQDDPSYLLVRLKSGTKQTHVHDRNVEIVRRLPDGYAIIKSSDAIHSNRHEIFDTILYANHLWKLSDDLLKMDVS